jgi:hypothetical protein
MLREGGRDNPLHLTTIPADGSLSTDHHTLFATATLNSIPKQALTEFGAFLPASRYAEHVKR